MLEIVAAMQNPLSVAADASREDLLSEITVWDVTSPESLKKHERKERHSSRFSRLVRRVNDELGWTGDCQKELALAKAALLEGTYQEKNELLRTIGSGRPLFAADGRFFYPCAPNPSNKLPQHLWLLSVPETLLAAQALMEAMFRLLGDFHQVPNIFKRAVRLKLPFSQTVPTAEGFHLERVGDIERNGFEFTNGCGLISKELLEAVKERFFKVLGTALSDAGRAHVRDATGVQLRVLGYKGLAVLDPTLEGKCLRLPDSMRKFTVPGKDQDLAKDQEVYVEGVPIEVVEFPRVKPANLTRQVLQVLEGNRPDVSQEVLRIQQRTLEEACSLAKDPTQQQALDAFRGPWSSSAFAHALSGNEHDNVANCFRKVLAGFDVKHDTHLRKQLAEIADRRTKDLAKSVPAEKCWYAMMVPDWSGTLPEGAVLVPWLGEMLNASEEETYCAIAKNPLYELGNLRRLLMVRPRDYPQLAHHQGYIVVSTHGQRPEPDKAFGADCDGDEALVIAHPALVPSVPTPEPQRYDATTAPDAQRPGSLAESIGELLRTKWENRCGLIDDALMNIASRGKDNMKREEYKGLAAMFCREVDAEKTGVHVRKCDIDALLNKVLGLKQGRNNNVPEFLAYTPDFQLKHLEGKREMYVDTLVNNIFQAAHSQFKRLTAIKDALVVEQLDPGLERAWQSLAPRTRESLLEKATSFRAAFRKAQQQMWESREERDDRFLSEVRRALLQPRRSFPIDDFLAEQRECARRAASSNQVSFEHFALALYICKYDDLRMHRQKDTCQFPWNIATAELIEIKDQQCRPRMLRVDPSLLKTTLLRKTVES